MYTDFYKLREKPFNIVPNPAYLYLSTQHRMALTYLEYGLKENIGFILLTGEIGIGKTTLVRRLMENLPATMETAVLSNTNLTPEDLLKQILREFELEPDSQDKTVNLEKLNVFLIDRYARGGRALLIIDEAQNLSLAALEEVRMLSNLQTRTDNLLQIMLVGQPELRSRIRDARLAQLAQRIAVSYHLAPLDRQETAEYITYRLENAGHEGDSLFSPDAMDLIYEKSKGVPRSINILCDMALVFAYGDEAPRVDRGLTEQVIAVREQEGVVPEGAVWVDAQENQTIPDCPEKEDTHRLQKLEARVEALSHLVQQQGQELQERLGEDKNSLIQTLQDLLANERAKSDNYLLKSQFYWKKAQHLQTRLSEKTGFSATEQTGSDADIVDNEPRSGFFERILK